MAKSFRGVAYWTVSTKKADWTTLACNALKPVEQHGMKVQVVSGPRGDELVLSFPDSSHHKLLITAGNGRGVVRVSENAGLFVVCLMALRKAVGDISVVTDSQEEVPTIPRQSFPLFEHDWPRIQEVGGSLSMVASGAFASRYAPVLDRLF